MSNIIAHIDGDELAYLIAFCSEDVTNEVIIELKVDKEIERLVRLVNADLFKLYLSGPREDSFRRRLLPSYKAHRDTRKPPKWLSHIKNYLLVGYGAEQHQRLEADDLLGLAITQQDDNVHIAITQDKDIRSVPGMSLNPRKPERGLVYTSRREALLRLMTQVLCGDPADGYKGCPGIGTVKSKKLLQGSTHRGWQKIYKEYLKKGLTRKDLHINYLCAKILRRHNEQ